MTACAGDWGQRIFTSVNLKVGRPVLTEVAYRGVFFLAEEDAAGERFEGLPGDKYLGSIEKQNVRAGFIRFLSQDFGVARRWDLDCSRGL